MGFGLPIVTTAVGGLVDVVEDGVTGLLTPPGDNKALAAAMARIAGDEALRLRLATGWANARERHSWKRIAALTMTLYESIVK